MEINVTTYLRYIVLAGLLLSTSPALSCALGFSFNFTPLGEHQQIGDKAGIVTRALDRKFGINGWKYSSGNLRFLPLSQIENSSAIPLTFGSKSVDMAGRISKIELYRIAINDVVEFTGNAAAQAQQVSAMFPSKAEIDSTIRLGPEKSSLLTAKIEQVASFRLNTLAAPLALPYVSIRIKAADSANAFGAMAIFYPASDGELPIVAATKILKLHSCDYHYVVKGAWPETLKEAYGYE